VGVGEMRMKLTIKQALECREYNPTPRIAFGFHQQSQGGLQKRRKEKKSKKKKNEEKEMLSLCASPF
jgi:hypothetical protein